MDWKTFIVGVALMMALVLVFWPEKGFYFRWKRRRRFDSRETIEDALKHLHQRQHDNRSASTESLANALNLSARKSLALAQRMESQGLLRATGQGLRLTGDGHRWASQVVRAHRLFERYLADETAVPMNEIHEHAHRLEHSLSAQELDKLEADLGYPASDPHGDPIPTATGEIATVESCSLVEWDTDKRAQIVHIEDEPPVVYAQIVAEGLTPGMMITVIESTPTRLVIASDTSEHVLAPTVAANISVCEAPDRAPVPVSRRLSALEIGEKARVVALDSACQGLTRRRFLDLGITPGVLIEALMQGAFREPVAYRVRNTTIALRHEQANLILIEAA